MNDRKSIIPFWGDGILKVCFSKAPEGSKKKIAIKKG